MPDHHGRECSCAEDAFFHARRIVHEEARYLSVVDDQMGGPCPNRSGQFQIKMCRFFLIEPRHGQWIWGRLTGRLTTADEDAARRDRMRREGFASSRLTWLRRSNRPTHHVGRLCYDGQRSERNVKRSCSLPVWDCRSTREKKPSGPISVPCRRCRWWLSGLWWLRGCCRAARRGAPNVLSVARHDEACLPQALSESGYRGATQPLFRL